MPEVTALFWVIKALSTALGESTSDWSVHAMNPVIAVLLGFCAFVLALSLQFWVRRYIAWTYWLAVCAVGVFGTMCADVLHVRFGVPYIVSTVLYGILLAAVFVSWDRTESTLSFHEINTVRREMFYWAAVVATFAMGTALGDLTAVTFNLGYFASAIVFAAVIAVPAVGYRWLGWNSIFCFWFAYVATRPLGASIADWLGKPSSLRGLGLGDGPVALVLAALIFGLVAYLAVTRRDVQGAERQSDLRPPAAAPGTAPAQGRGLALPVGLAQGAAEPQLVAVGIEVDGLPHAVGVPLPPLGLEPAGSDSGHVLIEIVDEHRQHTVTGAVTLLHDVHGSFLGQGPHGLGGVGEESRLPEQLLIPRLRRLEVPDAQTREEVQRHRRECMTPPVRLRSYHWPGAAGASRSSGEGDGRAAKSMGGRDGCRDLDDVHGAGRPCRGGQRRAPGRIGNQSAGRHEVGRVQGSA